MSRIRLALAIASLPLLAACSSTPAMTGEMCVDSADCELGLSCVEHQGAELSPVCMADCDRTMVRLCPGGEVCTPPLAGGPARDPNLGFCYLGGSTAVGDPCEGPLQCVRGAICVELSGDQSCYRACDTEDGSACEAGETCTELMDMGTNGFCLPTP